MSESNSFAGWLDGQFQKAGSDLTRIAAQAGISQAYLSMLRSGKRQRPSRHKVEALAQVLGVPVEDLPSAFRQRCQSYLPCETTERPAWDEIVIEGPKAVEDAIAAGWKPIDVTSFWRLARLEHAAPGYIQRKTEAYWDKVMRRAERERRRHAKAC